MGIEAMVLAAGGVDEAFGRAFGVSHKALVPLQGKPMLRWVLDALGAVPEIERRVVIGSPALAGVVGDGVELVPLEAVEYAASVALALSSARHDEVLLIACDVPLVRPVALAEWLERARSAEADLAFPVVTFDVLEGALPGARKTWYDLRDGRYTKGNAVLTRASLLFERLERVTALFETRKQKKWTALVGEQFVQRVLARAAALRDLEAGRSSYLGLNVRAVHAPPELVTDVDEVGDVAYCDQVLAARAGQTAAVR
ncbi:MAG: nucleotidyltransferase family protein [Armatimonadetes bacterium]|nr:nucleotidyltransferase family protein [Armatimonadota bacterium]